MKRQPPLKTPRRWLRGSPVRSSSWRRWYLPLGCSPLVTQQNLSRFHASDVFAPTARPEVVSTVYDRDIEVATHPRSQVTWTPGARARVKSASSAAVKD